MKTQSRFATSVFFFCATAFLGSCTVRSFESGGQGPSPSDQNAMESKDAWSKRPDRFYLSYMESDEYIPGGTDQDRVGNEFLFGLGCRKEDPEQSSLVRVPRSFRSGPNDYAPIALYDRIALHQFKEASNPKSLKENECLVLFGDPDVRQAIQNSPQNYSKGNKQAVIIQTMYTVSTCAGAMFSWGSLISALGTAGGGPIGLPLVSWWTGSGTVFCGMNLKFLYKEVENFKKQENMSLFYQALYKAELVADSALYGIPLADILRYRQDRKKKLLGSQFPSDPADESTELKAPPQTLHSGLKCTTKANAACGRYVQAIADTNWQLAGAIYNKIFVKSFNRYVMSTFEQGWGIDPRNQRFFDAVRDVQLEFAKAQGKNFQAYPAFKADDFSDLDPKGELSK
jgi:hypothetical protein